MSSKSQQQFKYLDREWFRRYVTLTKIRITYDRSIPKLEIDDKNRTIVFYNTLSKTTERKNRRIFFRIYRSKISGVRKLQREVKKEKNNLIRNYYLGKLESLRLEILAEKTWQNQSLSLEEKNLKIFKRLSNGSRLPTPAETEIFISEFIEFVKYTFEKDLVPKSQQKIFKSLIDENFYSFKYKLQDIDFDPYLKNYRASLKSTEESEVEKFNADKVKSIITRFISELGITENIKIATRSETFLFSIAPDKRRITIPANIVVTKKRLYEIITHEVCVHLYRSILGIRNTSQKNKKLYLLRIKAANGTSTEEGIATYFEQNLFFDSGKQDVFKLLPFYLRYIAVHLAQNFEPYEVYEKLLVLCLFQEKISPVTETGHEKYAKNLIKRIYRGIPFPQKGICNPKISQYLRGNRKIWEFVESGGNIFNLFAGKIRTEDIDDVRKLGFNVPEYFISPESDPRELITKMIEKSINSVK